MHNLPAPQGEGEEEGEGEDQEAPKPYAALVVSGLFHLRCCVNLFPSMLMSKYNDIIWPPKPGKAYYIRLHEI